MTALTVRATGRHHAPRKPGPLRRLKLRLIARSLREQAGLKTNAGRAARSAVACLALAVLTACLAGDIPPLNTTITAAVLGVALFVTGVIL